MIEYHRVGASLYSYLDDAIKSRSIWDDLLVEINTSSFKMDYSGFSLKQLRLMDDVSLIRGRKIPRLTWNEEEEKLSTIEAEVILCFMVLNL